MHNPILNVDSYKTSHWRQYPPGTEYVYSYIESRGGRYDKTLFFGLQAFIKEYLERPITKEHIEEADDFCKAHGVPFNREGWEYILEKHAGFLPVEIRAVPEGMVIPTKNILASVVNTDSRVPWITSHLETALLRAVWYPTTVATKSWYAKKAITEFYIATSDAPLTEVDYKLVDFGARGVSSLESAALGGMAHLVNFKTTDTIAGVLAASRYYHESMAGYSIPAAEHSTITSWGKENEAAAYRNMLHQFGGVGKTVAVVSDSWDIYNAVRHIWGEELRDEVNASGATVVIRPDSGDPIRTPIQVIKILDEKFGSVVNSKGYKVLPKHIRVLQGDGIDDESLPQILLALKEEGYSAENIIFGMGGGLLQQLDRDTQKFAMKCSAICINGVWQDVWKEAPGKPSKRGRLALIEDSWFTGKYDTVPIDHHTLHDVLKLVYRNGTLEEDHYFVDIRERADRALLKEVV